MSFTDFSWPVYEKSERQVPEDGIGADHLQVSLENLRSNSSQDGDELYTGKCPFAFPGILFL